MKTLTQAALVAALFALPAFAQESLPSFESDALWHRSSEPRIRFGIGSYTVGGEIGTPVIGFIGASGQLGVQLNDSFAIFAIAQGSTALVLNTSNAAVMGEYRLQHVAFGIGLGAAINRMDQLWGGESSQAIAANLPMRIAFNFGSRDEMALHARRQHFYLAVDGGVGVAVQATKPDDETAGLPGHPLTGYMGVSIGYVTL